VAIAPGLTIGLVRPSPARVTASTALNGNPVASTPTSRPASSGPTASQASAKAKGFATLMIVKATSASPTPSRSPPTDATQRPKCAGSARASAG
jgi:hypothetical protein